MAVYAVTNIRVSDPDRYAEYKEQAPPTIAHYGGKYLARGGKVEVLEGEWTPQRLVILEFESMERFNEWYNSPAYAHLSSCAAKPPSQISSLSKVSKGQEVRVHAHCSIRMNPLNAPVNSEAGVEIDS